MGQHKLKMKKKAVTGLLIKMLICVIVNLVKELGHGVCGFVMIFIRVMDIVSCSANRNYGGRDRSNPSF